MCVRVSVQCVRVSVQCVRVYDRTGLFSGGLFSVGLFSVGLFSVGLFSVGQEATATALSFLDIPLISRLCTFTLGVKVAHRRYRLNWAIYFSISSRSCKDRLSISASPSVSFW